MSRTYYCVRYLLNDTMRYFLWYTEELGDEADGVVVDEEKRIFVFRTQESLTAYAYASGLMPLAEVQGLYNFDALRKWLKRKRAGQIDCRAMLDAWNIFGDISASVAGNFDSDGGQTQTIYQKLFWGNNLPSITPPGRHYQPLWSGTEIRLMRQVLSDGLAMFRSHIGVELLCQN